MEDGYFWNPAEIMKRINYEGPTSRLFVKVRPEKTYLAKMR